MRFEVRTFVLVNFTSRSSCALRRAYFARSSYSIHVSKIIIGHLNSGSNKTVRASFPSHFSSICFAYSCCQGVENQAEISKTKAAISAVFSAGKPLGPDVPWRLVDYFEQMDIPSADALQCSVYEDTSVDRKCLQRVLSTWNSRLERPLTPPGLVPNVLATLFSL